MVDRKKTTTIFVSMRLLYKLDSIEQTKNIATILAMFVRKNENILLYGDIGVGKTTFSSYFIQSLCKQTSIPQVSSPTFPIVNSYETDVGIIYHLDLYRINTKEELFELGIEEIISYLCLIEWPEKLYSYIPKDFIKINLYVDSKKRWLEISFSQNYVDIYNSLKKHDI